MKDPKENKAQYSEEEVRKTRLGYWNEQYRDYWMKRVHETNDTSKNISDLNPKDKLTSSDESYIQAIKMLEITPQSVVLEMGCGYGRSIPFLSSISRQVQAIDISEAMIETAKETNRFENVAYHVSEAEKTPFENDTFDVVICFGVFDAVFQGKALVEMNRISKKRARLLITGKNDNYFDDDEEAYIAEVRAREKGHPNYFTDVAMLLPQLDRFGFQLGQTKFFERRGDAAAQKFKTEIHEKFYEYLLILEKKDSIKPPVNFSVSDPFSKTFRRRNGS